MKSLSKQRGAVLVNSVLVLGLVSLVSVTAVQGTLVQKKISSGLQNKSTAFQAAETALRFGEASLSKSFVIGKTPGYFEMGARGRFPWRTIDWHDADQVARYDGKTIDGVVSQPAYIVERVGLVTGQTQQKVGFASQQGPSATMYRVTARGVGATPSAVSIVQSYFVE